MAAGIWDICTCIEQYAIPTQCKHKVSKITTGLQLPRRHNSFIVALPICSHSSPTQLNSTQLNSTRLALYWIGFKKPNSHWIVYSTFDTGWYRFRWLLRSRRPVVPSFVSSSVPIGVVAASVVTVVAAVPLLIAWSLSALIFTGCVVGIITVVVGVVGVVVVAASNGCLNGCSVWHHCQHNLLVCLCVCVFMQF